MKQAFLLAILVFLVSCESTTSTSTSASSDVLKSAADAYNKNKSLTTAGNYIQVILSELGKTDISQSDRKKLLETGLAVSEENKLSSKKLSFLYPLVRSFDSDANNDKRLLDMANVMKTMKKYEGANVIFHNLAMKGGEFAELKNNLTEAIPDIDEYIKNLGEKIFVDPDFNGVNKKSSQNYVDACESYALSAASNEAAPAYLFKAAEIARTIRTFPKVMSLYDWISEKYPNYEKTPTVLFLKGFVVENDLKNSDKAKEIYETFLEKYPSHELADDVKFLIEHIGKSDEEILQIIESKKANKQ